MDKILVTGSAGYIGVNLLNHIELYDCEYQTYDLEYGEDIRNWRLLSTIAKGCNAIIHLAAMTSIPECEENPMDAWSHNVHGTAQVATLSEKMEIPLVFASSASATNPIGIYGGTKRMGERIVASVGGVSLRLANVYGGAGFKNKDVVIANFIEAKKRGRRGIIYGDGTQTRDFIHVDDVCQAFLYGLAADPGIYEVSTGVTTSINDLAKMLQLRVEHHQKRVGELQYVTPDPSNWLPLWTPKIGLEEWIKL